MTAQVRPSTGGGGGGGDHPDLDHATLTTVIAGLAAEITARAAADTAHAGAPDPHPGYLTPTEGNAAYDALGAAATAQAAAIAASQPADADLTAISALTTTAYGRALLALADAAAARTAIGLSAANTAFTPAGTVAATTVQAAIEEVASEAGAPPALAPSWVPVPILDFAGSGAIGANAMESTLAVVQRPTAVNRVLFYVTTSSGNVDVGIYDDDGTGGGPGTRLVSSGSVPCPAPGAAAVTITTTLLAPGRYWAALVPDNGTADFRYGADRLGIRAFTPTRASKASSFPLPATISGAGFGGDDNVYFISLAVA
jgi:hypothetical protein